MFTYYLQPRFLQLRKGTRPPLPHRATVTVTFTPKHLFGGKGGPLSAIILGSDTEVNFDANTGRATHTARPPLRSLRAAAALSDGGKLTLRGNKVRYSFTCRSARELASVIGTLHLAVPAILNLALTDPPASYATTARVGHSEFLWHHRHALVSRSSAGSLTTRTSVA